MVLRKIKQRLGKLIIPRLPVTRHVFNHIRWELRAIWVRVNNKLNPLYILRKRKIRMGSELSVNVACGGSGKKGWVNLDLMNHKYVSLRCDCRRDLPLRQGSVARIRCEQFFEHLDHNEEAPLFLKSCYRSLKKGGVLRIIVPDAGRFLLSYQSGNKDDWINLGLDLENLPNGFHTKMDIINHIFRQCEEHMYAYDFETISLLLRRAGFDKVQKSEFGISLDSQLADDMPINKLHSLYVEAIK
jgi:predicted SAM-dependent methyltransferase